MTHEEIANYLSLRWANRHINHTTWLELLELHLEMVAMEDDIA